MLLGGRAPKCMAFNVTQLTHIHSDIAYQEEELEVNNSSAENPYTRQILPDLPGEVLVPHPEHKTTR